MSMITEPFRIRLQKEIRNLKQFKEALMDARPGAAAIDTLVKTWETEQGAMSYATIPIALDAMLLTAVVDNRKLILELASEVRASSPRLDGITNRLEKGEAFGW